MPAVIGAVAIGRNEGLRLERCLQSLGALRPRLVYVDSGSTDTSVSRAKACGADVVHLDMRQKFTAARARNAGLQRLRQLAPEVELVQFLDGDCELIEGWLAVAEAALQSDADLAAVCGRNRERNPQVSPYNLLCDMEWNTPIGEARECGGNALMRVAAVAQVGGFNEQMIAGEEPELCVRLRQAGWKIRRLDQDMAWHDAAMTRLSQWAKRSERGGHAYAEAVALHGGPPERQGVRESLSIWLWAALWPIITLVLTLNFGPAGLLTLVAYPLLSLKIAARRRQTCGDPWTHAGLYGLACVAAKWPQLLGQLRFVVRRGLGRPGTLIEYK